MSDEWASRAPRVDRGHRGTLSAVVHHALVVVEWAAECHQSVVRDRFLGTGRVSGCARGLAFVQSPIISVAVLSHRQAAGRPHRRPTSPRTRR